MLKQWGGALSGLCMGCAFFAVPMSPACQERALALTWGEPSIQMEIRACELLCRLNSKGEEISTMLLSSDLSVQAGFLTCGGWMNGCMDCWSLSVSWIWRMQRLWAPWKQLVTFLKKWSWNNLLCLDLSSRRSHDVASLLIQGQEITLEIDTTWLVIEFLWLGPLIKDAFLDWESMQRLR